jgi:hypothetical protein
MPGQNLEGKIGGKWVDEVDLVVVHPVVIAASAFALGLVTGLFLKDAAKQTYERARRSQTHRDYERTVTYDANLPDSLGRREPAQHAEQPRFGGTGALGVSPASMGTVKAGRPGS